MTAVARRARRAAAAAANEPPPFPTSIRVGHRDIVVELHPSDEMDGANGDFLDSKQRIRICNDLMPQTMAEVLNHEVGHACFCTFRWTLVGDVEEANRERSVCGVDAGRARQPGVHGLEGLGPPVKFLRIAGPALVIVAAFQLACVIAYCLAH